LPYRVHWNAPRPESAKICVFYSSRAPAPDTGVDGNTGIDGLRRGVRWSRVREGLDVGWSIGHAALAVPMTEWHGMYARMEVVCRVDMTHYVCCRVGESEKNQLIFNRPLGIACFSSGRLCRLDDHRRLVGEPDSVGCRWICLEGTIGI
jgi:hypothetical protein